ncbi:hypothetical protein RFI_03992 [Reticulomyxa filosa]|uniref:Kelch motif family protein n=1 Tax=Reticulomyxa filosa TaxID=46433 RepID=X6P4R2_RETFI|nr:hypothetical protein RFI_03992 [Reticulomyxa filosa]|eukprot:ETO33113.1 hypothetical protein RFI_03992 [Reticulomyxa filosa]
MDPNFFSDTSYFYHLTNLDLIDISLFIVHPIWPCGHFFLKKVLKKFSNMGNRSTTQKSTSIPFQMLKVLPTSFERAQCVLYKHELLICGGFGEGNCYSYDILKNEYKFICEYPSHAKLFGHCVVKLLDNNNNKDSNEITLLSFGGYTFSEKYTLMMNKNYNQWIPFTDNHNHPITIGRYEDNYEGARAVIGGSNNHLLFITYLFNDISVFNLNTFQFINHDVLPTNDHTGYHCFVSKSKTNKKNYEMLLFCKKTGLSIEYDEDNNTFQFYQLLVCDDIASLNQYSCVCVNGVILFFGGYCYKDDKQIVSKSVYKYLIQENKWITFENTLPSPLYNCVAILNEDNTNIYIIGGKCDKNTELPTHMKTKLRVWDVSQLSKNDIKFVIQYWIRILKIKLGWVNDFDKIIIKYSAMS